MNKKERQNKTFYKYKKRASFWAAIWNEDLQEILRERKYNQLKSQTVLCSCWICSKHNKYKRYLKKVEDRRLIKEG